MTFGAGITSTSRTYARGRHHTFVETVERDPTTHSLRVRLSGVTDVPLKLYVLEDVDAGVDCRFLDVPAFQGSTEVAT